MAKKGVEKVVEKDVFEDAPGFLAAFNQVVEKGFFEALNVNFDGYEKRISGFSIKAHGLLPNDVKYKGRGCAAIVDPNTIIDNCRKDIRRRKVKNITVKIETSDWEIWNRKDEVIGSKGQRVSLSLVIHFR